MFWMFIAFLVGALVLHELGHAFFMMKKGVEMKTIAIGFPPLIFSKNFAFKKVQEKPIALGIGLLPLGAYVQPSSEGQKHLKTLPLHDKIHIYGAGVMTHLVTVVGLLLLFLVLGVQLTSVGFLLVGVSASLVILFFVRPAVVGVLFTMLGLLFVSFIVWSLLGPSPEGTLVGPIGIGKLAADVDSVKELLMMALAISVNLGAGNAIPFMPLDGGHILFAYLEKFFGEASVRSIKISMALIGWILVLLFAVFIVFRDLKSL